MEQMLMSSRDKHRRYVTIAEFTHDMMGKKSKSWYYNMLHKKLPGFPQRHYFPGSERPMLDYQECIAWQNQATKTPPWKPRRR
jgi:hypothetical protein